MSQLKSKYTRPSRVELNSKVGALQQLRDSVLTASVLPIVSFSKYEWDNHRLKVVRAIEPHFPVIIRSSCEDEDKPGHSNAGAYESVLNVRDPSELYLAVDKVFASYGSLAKHSVAFAQPMIEKPRLCGVAFSSDPNTRSPYLIINYDESGSTNRVTSGKEGAKIYYYYPSDISRVPSRLQPVCALIDELKGLTGESSLDVEFAIDANGQLILLQCRSLNAQPSPADAKEVKKRIVECQDRIGALSTPHPYLLGRTSLFGIMPDWNPAEMIGVCPKPLAMSLYRTLITDNIWAYQRDNYGYRNLRSFPLMVSLAGHPYIDVRVSFNSFIPKTLDEKLGEKLVNYYLRRLERRPEFHDKVEFEILFTCYDFGLPEKIKKLQGYGFSKNETEEIVESLHGLTNQIVHGTSGYWKADVRKTEELEERVNRVQSDPQLDRISKLYWLIEDCQRYGTLPFAGLARCAFIAVQLLNSLVESQVLSATEKDAFLASLHTVSGQLGFDYQQMDKRDFLEKYGHLRPGTYDILSARYDVTPDDYFDWNKPKASPHSVQEFKLGIKQMRRLESLLTKHKLELNVIGLFDFIRNAIEARELAKFRFTKSVSEILEGISQLGTSHGFDRNELAYMDLNVLKTLYVKSGNAKQVMQESILAGQADHLLNKKIQLPPLIANADQVWSFELPEYVPNFVTQLRVQGPVGCMEGRIEGTILFIESADPGYDWIFSKSIVGLITKHGGANSHMAIRCAELKIPAAIGVGEQNYVRWSQAAKIDMDCQNKTVRVLS